MSIEEHRTRRIGYVEVSLEVLKTMLFPRGSYPSMDVECSLPEDVKIIGIEQTGQDRINGLCRVYLESEHESFPIHQLGQQIARLPTPTMKQTVHG